jgi:hypothetical protein
VRLGFVAGREDDARADDYRPATEPRVIPLLDRREERVDVGVQDRGFRLHRTYVRTTPGEVHASPPGSRLRHVGPMKEKPPLRGRVRERTTGVEPATFGLGSRRSTN